MVAFENDPNISHKWDLTTLQEPFGVCFNNWLLQVHDLHILGRNFEKRFLLLKLRVCMYVYIYIYIYPDDAICT